MLGYLQTVSIEQEAPYNGEWGRSNKPLEPGPARPGTAALCSTQEGRAEAQER